MSGVIISPGTAICSANGDQKLRRLVFFEIGRPSGIFDKTTPLSGCK